MNVGCAIFITGTPGAGKSTLARNLATTKSWALLSGSALLRAYTDDPNAEFSVEVREAMQQGRPLRSEIVLPLYRAFLSKICRQSVVIDGNPADIDQLRAEAALLEELGYLTDCTAACTLFLPAGPARERLKNRRACAACRISCTETACPRCGHETISRTDDLTKTAIDERLQSFSVNVVSAVRVVFPWQRRLSLRATVPEAQLLQKVRSRFEFCA